MTAAPEEETRGFVTQTSCGSAAHAPPVQGTRSAAGSGFASK